MTTNELLERIDQIISTKKSENKAPLHALFYRDLLSGNDREELKKSLREFARQDKIHIGNTINDYYITIKHSI